MKQKEGEGIYFPNPSCIMLDNSDLSYFNVATLRPVAVLNAPMIPLITV
jgi:hypothetical protein